MQSFGLSPLALLAARAWTICRRATGMATLAVARGCNPLVGACHTTSPCTSHPMPRPPSIIEIRGDTSSNKTDSHQGIFHLRGNPTSDPTTEQTEQVSLMHGSQYFSYPPYIGNCPLGIHKTLLSEVGRQTFGHQRRFGEVR